MVTVLCLSLVWADGEEKVEREEAQPEFTPPPRPAGDVYFTENFQDPEAVWSRLVVVAVPITYAWDFHVTLCMQFDLWPVTYLIGG